METGLDGKGRLKNDERRENPIKLCSVSEHATAPAVSLPGRGEAACR
jgi:hypothetical protein